MLFSIIVVISITINCITNIEKEKHVIVIIIVIVIVIILISSSCIIIVYYLMQYNVYI